MIPRRLLVSVACLLVGGALAQTVVNQSTEAPGSATAGVGRLPRDAFAVGPDAGVRYRSIFRDTEAPYVNSLRPLEAEPETRIGSVETRTRLGLPNIHGKLPFLERGFAPKDADLKAGPVYFKLRALTAGFLFSDNVNHEENDRESGLIGIVRLGGALTVQLTEDFHLSIAGNVIWLPFQNKIGVTGFGLVGPYTLGLEGVPILRSQVVWETEIGGWRVIFADEFRIGFGHLSVSDRDSVDVFDGGGFDEQDRAGRYVFGGRGSRATGRTRNGRETRDTETEIVYYSNRVSVTADRLLPGPIRLRARASHENLWYNQGNRGLPGIRDTLSFSAVSERETMRFKPFFSFRATRTGLSDGFSEETRTGFDGPITDQLTLHADAGWFHRDSTGANSLLWDLHLRHIAGPYTRELLSFSRSYHDLSDELRDELSYSIDQVLGPRFNGEAFASFSKVEDLGDSNFSREEWRTGVRLSFIPGPRTTMRLSVLYTDRDSSGDLGHRQSWTERLELTYRFTDNLVSRLLYQHQDRESDRHGDSFAENLVILTLSKYFD